MSAKNINSSNFESEVLKSEVPVLVDFWGPGCQPCARMAPVIDHLASTSGDALKVVKVDTSEAPELAVKYGVRAVPTFLVIQGGKVVQQRVGAMSRDDLEEWLSGN